MNFKFNLDFGDIPRNMNYELGDIVFKELKPYVSYRSPDILQEAITAKDIFDECLAPKVIEDYKAGKYDSLQTQEDLVKS
ncbi:large ribosomal subunit protein mL41-like [Saccoglossus kowalevskii]